MFLVCGEALLDLFATPASSGRLAIEGVPGGSPFNVAIGLARLGVETGFLGGLSRDSLGDLLAARLAEEGVSLRFAVRRPERTTLSLVGLGRDGVPTYSFYGPGAEAALSSDALPDPGPEIEGLHLGSYTSAVAPVADALAELAFRTRDRLVAFDPNIRTSVVPDLDVWRERIAALLPNVGIVKASEEDLAALYPEEESARIARDWLARGPGLVVITRGSRGASGFSRAVGEVRVDAPKVEVVDTVGAGDAFQAALIAGLLDAGIRDPGGLATLTEDRLRHLLSRCALAGAMTCGRRGADPPTRGSLDEGIVAGP